MVERFSKEQFEAALPFCKTTGVPLWLPLGLIDGEYSYTIPVTDTNKRIIIRSSIGPSGIAADTGEDSIRLWVEYHYKDRWYPLAKRSRWVTRIPNWEGRITDKLRELYELALTDSNKHPQPTTQPAPKPPAEADDPMGFLGNTPTAQETTGQDVVTPPTTRCVTPSGNAPRANPEQLAAIQHNPNVAAVVLAGPGTGKTFVLSHRYAFLLEQGYKPENILAVTFSKDMSTELLSRVLTVSPQAVGTAAETQICTIHAACYRMLKANGDKRMVAKTWVVKKHVQELAEKLWPYTDERPGWEEIMAFVNTAKAHGLTSANDLEWFVGAVGYDHGSRLHELRRELDIRLERERVLTFADMLLDIEVKLNRDRAFREKWQAHYQVILVDEGQDTSAQAMRILSTLAAPQDRFFIVGDTDQLLYRFAGATPEANLFDGFENRFPNGMLYKLTRNYRSSRRIIETYNRLIGYNYAAGGGPYDDKYRKLVEAHSEVEGDPITWQMYSDPEEEAAALAEDIAQTLSRGDRQPGDYFVGARTRAQLGYLEGPLTRAKVPFINITGGSFWGSKHVADVVGYVRLAYNEGDNKAFQRVFNIGSNWCVAPWGDRKGEYCTHRYLGKAFLEATKDYKSGQPSYQFVYRAAEQKRSHRPGVDDLVSLLRDIQADMAGATDAGQVVASVLDNCYVKWLKHEEGLTSGDEAENGKLEDLYTVVQIASGFETVAEFLDYVTECEKATEAAKDKSWDGYVVLSTIHRLKGLERPVVYGVGLCENGEKGLLPHTFSMSDPPQFGVLPTGNRGRIEDERCCFYVLVSRAKEEVHLSGVESYRKDTFGPSRFIAELGLSIEGEEAE